MRSAPERVFVHAVATASDPEDHILVLEIVRRLSSAEDGVVELSRENHPVRDQQSIHRSCR